MPADPAAIVKSCRTALGLSQGQFAHALGLAGEHARITVSEWERGQKQPSGPVMKLIAIWMDARCQKWARPKPEE